MSAGLTGEAWNAAIRDLPGAHMLQTWEWAQFKTRVGWRPLPQVWRDDAGVVRAAAMVRISTAPSTNWTSSKFRSCAGGAYLVT